MILNGYEARVVPSHNAHAAVVKHRYHSDERSFPKTMLATKDRRSSDLPLISSQSKTSHRTTNYSEFVYSKQTTKAETKPRLLTFTHTVAAKPNKAAEHKIDSGQLHN